MPQPVQVGSSSDERLHKNDTTECLTDSYKKLLPDCVLDTERSRKRLSEILHETKSFCSAVARSTCVTAVTGSVSVDRDSPRASNQSDAEPYVIMNPPSSSTSSSASFSTSTATSSHSSVPMVTTSLDVKLPPGVDEKALQKLFPLNTFTDELPPSAASRDEEDRPLAGLCAALLGRALRDGLGRAYVHGVLAVARTVAHAFHSATLAWRDPRSDLDLFDLALRHGNASALLQLSSFSEEFRERLVDKEKQLSPREVSNVQDIASKLSNDGSFKNDCGSADSSKTLAKDSDSVEIKPKGRASEDHDVSESPKRSSESRYKVPWQNYDSIAQHLISVEHQRCDINRNACPLLRPCSALSLQGRNTIVNINTSPWLSAKSYSSEKDGDGSESPHGGPRDTSMAATKLRPSCTEGSQVSQNPLILSPNLNKPTLDGNEIPTAADESKALNMNTEHLQTYETTVDMNPDDDENSIQGKSHSLTQVSKTSSVCPSNREDSSLLGEDRDISGSSSPDPYQETTPGQDLTRHGPTSSLKCMDPVEPLPRPRGILKLGRKRHLGSSRSVTFSADTKSGSPEFKDYEDGLYTYYSLRRCPGRASLNEWHDSYNADLDARVYVNVRSPVTRGEGEASFAESSLSDSLEEHLGSLESDMSSNDGQRLQDAGSVSLCCTAPRPTFDRLASSPKKSADSYLECNCMGCYWLKSMASRGSGVEEPPSKPNGAALKAFEVKSSSMSKLASLSSFLTRKAGKARKFVKNARAPKNLNRCSTSTGTGTPHNNDGLDVVRVQDETLDRAFVDQRANCKSFASVRQEGKMDNQSDGASSICSHGHRHLPGQSGWSSVDCCYANGFSNPAFCDKPPPTDDDESGTTPQQVLSDFRLSIPHRDENRSWHKTSVIANQSSAGSHFYESLDDTLVAVDEMIRESVNQISLLNVSQSIPFDPDVTPLPQRREVPGMESFLKKAAWTTSPEKRTAGTSTIQRLRAPSSQQGTDATYYTSMRTSVAVVAGEVRADPDDESTRTRQAPAGLTVDSPFHVACYFGSPMAVAQLARSRDLDLDLDFPGAVTLAGRAPDGEDSFKHGVPTFRSHRVVGTPINLCEMGGHLELASMLRELRAAA